MTRSLSAQVFSANITKDEAAIQSELIDIQAAGDMKAALCGAESLSTFWVACSQENSTLKTLAVYVLTIFWSTNTFEAVFSKMNKSNRLSNQSLKPDSGEAWC